MSVQEQRCLVIRCDQCEQPHQGYEGEFTVHFDSLEQFVQEQADYDEDTRWRTEGDKHYCADCACERDGHPRGDQIYTFSDGRRVQWCRCGRSWPVTEAS